MFSMEQFCQWFDLTHITPSAAQFNTEKLNWFERPLHPSKAITRRWQASSAPACWPAASGIAERPCLEAAVGLYKERVATLNELADAVEALYVTPQPAAELVTQHLNAETLPILADFAQRLPNIAWEAAAIGACIKETVAAHGAKMPKLAMPLRVLLVGQTQTPSVDALVALFDRADVLARIQRAISA